MMKPQPLLFPAQLAEECSVFGFSWDGALAFLTGCGKSPPAAFSHRSEAPRT